MQDAHRTFSYTARRNAFLTVVGTFGFAVLLECAVYVLIIALAVHNLPLKLVLLGGFAGVTLWLIFGVLLAPLWTKHELSATQLTLRYGRRWRAVIPRAAILSVTPVHEQLTPFQTAGVQYAARQQRITACFSQQGQLLLRLREPLSLKVGRNARPTRTILFNVDEPEAFLQALAAQQATKPEIKHNTQQPAEQPEAGISTLVASTLPSATVGNGEVAVRIEGLTRRYGDFTAVEPLAMRIARGEIYGFLGSNGAGKTTTIKMLVGLLQPSAGKVWIAGHGMWSAPEEAKRQIGYVADRSILYERLSGREFLRFLAQVRGLAREEGEQRIATLLKLLELEEYADRLCGSYSFGMKRKLSLAGALLHQPPVLILDEPLNGLDPHSARRLKDLFSALAASGTTILFSTHDLATAEALCQRVGIFHKGKLLAEGSVAELRQAAAGNDLEAVFLNLTASEQELVLPEEAAV